ncbi:peptidoglycan-binding protein [Fusobacterium polymorphum]|uniref:Peptidoglycan-binding protein n=1 Tax=Fusobacterium nucleatum subsp. polymorphum TaxID=76857 RepID=A0A2B7YP98_FUSNP|nr:YHYH domain-containing protein [Fusobacterium polymorphum]PGH22457.1 peptidoglycan-binding protein [Fusobacterium polymorphum]
MKKKLFTLFVLLSLLAFSHPGRTDANGGHRDRKNGSYHYHHGYPAHDHPNGVCPYESPKSTSNKSMSKAEIKKNLETLGYYGNNAIAEFQKDNGLVADGVAGKRTVKRIRERLEE